MKEFVKVWQDDEGKVQIEIDDSAPWQDVAIRMVSLFAEENDQRALKAHVTVTGFLLGLEETGDFQKKYLANVQRVAELVRDLAIKQRELDKKALKVKKPKKAS